MNNLSVNGNNQIGTPGLASFWQKGWEVENLRPAVSSSGSNFSPSSLADLELWLRSDLGITLNGSDVSAWADQSGNARDYAQATAALQPAYNTSSGINGLPTLDTTSAGTERMGVDFQITGAQSIFIVFKFPSTPGGSKIYLLDCLADSGTPGGGPGSLILACNFAGYQPYTFGLGAAAGGAVCGVNEALDTNPHYMLVTYDGSGVGSTSAYKFYLDGVEKTVVASGTFISTFYGNLASMGTTSGGNYPANSAIAEKIVTSSVMSASDRAALFAYASSRYNI